MNLDKELDHFPHLRERTLPGVHNELIESVLHTCPLPGWQSVLDIGAGEGALSSRLKLNGYEVEAIEKVEGRFSVPEVKCYNLDLNGRFAEGIDKKFDILIANHIIEHLENPRSFLRECRNLLTEKGRIFIIFPNVESWESRLGFLRLGCFPLFRHEYYLDQGHITPFFSWQMDQICSEESLSVLKKHPVGIGPNLKDVPANIWNWSKFIIKKILYMSLQPALKGSVKGPSNMFVLEKLR